MNSDEVKKIELGAKDLKREYQKMEGKGLDHFLAWLEVQERSDRRTAETEVDNPARRAVYLQSSIAYTIVRSHLAKMLESA